MHSKVTKGRLLVRISLLISLLTMVLLAQAFSNSPEDEYLRKAKIISKIIKLVGWPENSIPKDHITICIYGNLAYTKELNSLQGTTVIKHKLVVKKVENIEDPGLSCNLVYVCDVPTPQQVKVIKMFDKKPVLLIGDMDSFALRGGAMNFTYLNKALAVTVNMETMKSANLGLDLNKVNEITVIPEPKDLK